MRTSSGDRKVRPYNPPGGFRSDSQRKPSTDSNGFRSRESGMGWDGSGGDLEKWEGRRSREFEFVRTHLPDQHPGLAVVALLAIRQSGEQPTRDRILARLEATGRTTAQMREKGWIE